MLFFAWGTNMDASHLRRWLPSARRLTVASLPGHAFRFHKRSSGGAKSDAYHTGDSGDVVWGIIYELSEADAAALDKGQRDAGYEPKTATVFDREGAARSVVAYVAGKDWIDASQRPWASYKDPIVRAARENGLPEDYVSALERMPADAC